MSRVLVLNDANNTRVVDGAVANWSYNSGSGYFTMNLLNAGSATTVTYQMPNQAIAMMVLGIVDAWYFGQDNLRVSVQDALGTILIYTVASQAHNSSGTIAITGIGFQTGAMATIGNIGGKGYSTTFSDAQGIAINYDGLLPAGTYDVTIRNPDQTTFTLPNSLSLT